MPEKPAAQRYRTLFELASGGMGTVFVAERREGAFRRLYALKRLSESDPDAEAMFLDEARLAGMLRHPNVVSVLDYGRDEQGPFLLMDLVEGVSLSKIMIVAEKSRSPMPLQHVLGIGAQIAEGLAAAHELRDEWGEALRVVHRDVSPQNVLIGFDGSVRLTDFGIARAARREASTTSGNVLKGKMSYMSPEQLRFRQPDARSDLFALGVLLYEMAAGKRLYRGDDAPLRILEEPPPNLRAERADAPEPLRELTRKLLAKDPSERPQTAREVADVLHSLHAEQVTKAGRESLADYVARVFPSAEAVFRSRLRAAAGLALASDPPLQPVAPVPRKWLAAAVGAVLLLVGIGWAVSSSGGMDDGEAPVAPPAREPAVSRAPSPPASAEPVQLAPAPSTETAESENSPAAMEQRRRRRPRMGPSKREGVLEVWPD